MLVGSSISISYKGSVTLGRRLWCLQHTKTLTQWAFVNITYGIMSQRVTSVGVHITQWHIHPLKIWCQLSYLSDCRTLWWIHFSIWAQYFHLNRHPWKKQKWKINKVGQAHMQKYKGKYFTLSTVSNSLGPPMSLSEASSTYPLGRWMDMTKSTALILLNKKL